MRFDEVKLFKKFIEIGTGNRLYYSPNVRKGSGFDFIGLVCTGWFCDGENEYYFSPKSMVSVIVEGTAYFDGIRHLYYGKEESDNYGYHYYPNLPKIIKVLKELRKLEEKYCSEFEI